MSVNTHYGAVNRYPRVETIEDKVGAYLCVPSADVKVISSTIGKIESAGFVSMLRSKSDHVNALGYILDLYGTIGMAISKKHIFFDNTTANNVKADGDIRLRFSKIYDDVTALTGNVYISHSTIQGSVFTYKNVVHVQSSHVLGAVVCPNVHLEIKDSTINHLILTKPAQESVNQTVVLRNSHVTRITFENGMGFVKLEGSSQVGQITGGSFI